MTTEQITARVIEKAESVMTRPLTEMEKAIVNFTVKQLELDLLDY